MPTARRARRLSADREAVWDVVSDPYHLPRWWPRVSRVESVAAERWTKVFGTRKGKSVRADERLLDSDPLARRSWTQELEESPFERMFREVTTEVRLEPEDGGTRVLVHDDLLATGGTTKAKIDLVEGLGGVVVGCAYVIELAFLRGREALAGYEVHSLVSYDEEA